MYTHHPSVVEQFDTKHGGDPIFVDEDEILLFADGARRTNGAICMLHEPPADIRQRGPLMIKYHEIKFQRASQEFNDLKLHLTYMLGHARRTAASRFPMQPPNDQQLERLENLQAKAQRLQRTWTKVKKAVNDEIAQHPEVQREAQSVAHQQRMTEEAAKRLDKIKL